jgi:TolB-like protein/Flp pilus assembly protein TadD
VTLSGTATPVLRFAGFELDLRTAELSGGGIKTTLPEQPFRILTLLLEHPGEVVTREALRKRLWSNDVFVDFDDGLNSAIRRLRLALGDSAEHPRLLETLPRHGYRLKVQIQPNDSVSLAESANPPSFRVAVLPLDNFSGDLSEEYLADGMTDAIITALVKIPHLRVISRTSTMVYKNAGKILPQIASELRADALLEGAIVRSGDRVRITVQLVDAISDQHLWAESYERQLGDKLRWQEELSQLIAAEIPLRLTRCQVQPIHTLSFNTLSFNTEAYTSYLKGRYLIENTGRNDYALKKATFFFEEAVSEAPLFAEAYAGIAQSYDMSAIFCLLPVRQASAKAQEAARKAIEIDRSISEAHAALGYALMLVWRWQKAAREFEEAIELNPNNTIARRWYAEYLMAVGQTAKAVAQIERAREIEPLSVITNSTLGWLYYGARQFDQAAEQFRGTVELDENFAATFLCSGMLYAQQGRYKEAIAEYERARALGCTVQLLRALGFLYGIAGERARAHEVIQESKRLAKSGCSVAYATASIYAGLGERSQAFEWLNKACDDCCAEMTWLKWDPQLDILRSDPRFDKLLERVGLAQ